MDAKAAGKRLEVIVNDYLMSEDISLTELNNRLGTTITTYRWITRGLPKSLILLSKMCETFGVSADYILFGDEKNE